MAVYGQWRVNSLRLLFDMWRIEEKWMSEYPRLTLDSRPD